jgi:glycosyltransferase involved in cell wall biosynthesis
VNRREQPAEALDVALTSGERRPTGGPHRVRAESMRVAVNSLFWGQEGAGSGQYLHNLLPSLAHLEPSASYVLLGPATGRAAGAGAGPWPRHTLRTPFDGRSENLAKVWFEQVAYPRACRRIGADVAHVPYFAPPLFPTVPTVVTIHDLIPLILPEYRATRAVRAYMALVARAARRAHVVVTDSQASARDIERLLGLRGERVRVIYLAADARYRPVAPAECRPVRERLGLPEEYLLYLGGMDRRKNVPVLLDAYALARERLGGLPLVLAGRLPERDTLFAQDPRPLIGRLGLAASVHLPGWVDEADKPALYSGAVGFCFPSAYEGFGLPVLEAISCGTPAIVASGSSLEEVAGAGGLVVPAGDAPALAEALVRLVREPGLREDLSRAGLQHAQRFSWQRTAAQTLAAYEQALQSVG